MAQRTAGKNSTSKAKTKKYSRHAVVIKDGRIVRNYTWLAGFVVIILMGIICSAVNKASDKLEDKNEVYEQQIEALDNQIAEQKKRREDLQTRSIYITTKQFVEDFAREKLGLVFEDEIIFRPEDN